MTEMLERVEVERSSSRTPQLVAAWTGPAAVLLALLGMVIVGGFIPARHPDAGSASIAAWYVDHTTRIRIGMVLSALGFSLFVPFGIAIALQTRRTERKPILSWIQIACVAIASVEGVLSCCVWVAAAFRPDTIDPTITRALNDLGWMTFLFDVAPFSLWIITIGVAILRDPRAIFPRWVGWLNVFVAFVIEPATMVAFFQTGPLAFNGLLALYLPFGAFFAWICVMSPVLIKAIQAEPEDELAPG